MVIVSGVDVEALLQSGTPVLDVLPASGFRRSHIRGARSMPLADLDLDAVALDPALPCVVYCYDRL